MGFRLMSGNMEDLYFTVSSNSSLCVVGCKANYHRIYVDAIIITLYKNEGEKSDCSNYRGITLLSIAGKILARILLNRLMPNIAEEHLPESQCGFRTNRSTTDMVFVLRQLQEKFREQNKALYVTLTLPKHSTP